MYRIFILFFFSFSIGCSNNLEEVSFYSITDDLNIALNQNVTNEGPYLMLELSTKQNVDCSNALFNYSLNVVDDQITLNIYDLVLTEPCNETQGIVKTKIPLNLNSYQNEITIVLRSLITNSGELTYANNRFTLEFEDAKGFTPTKSSILKIPDNSVWGALSFPEDSINHYTQQFNSFLQSHQINDNYFQPGDYGLFNYSNNNVQIGNLSISNPSLTFFTEINNWEDFKTEFQEFIKSHQQVSYYIRTSNNQSI